MPPILTPADLPPEWFFLWNERAAIRTFDGGAPVEVAEREAFEEIVQLMRQATN